MLTGTFYLSASALLDGDLHVTITSSDSDAEYQPLDNYAVTLLASVLRSPLLSWRLLSSVTLETSCMGLFLTIL
jgi:hypothetical protein